MNAVKFATALALVSALLVAAAFEPVRAAQPQVKPYCAAEGRDCILWMKQAGPPAYCGWAAQMAAYGAFARDKEMSWLMTQGAVTFKFDRPMTVNERTHIDKWLKWGWDSELRFDQIMNKAYDSCMRDYV